MTSWWVVCTKSEVVGHPKLHTHIVGVGTGDRADWADLHWTIQEVLEALDEGDTFYTRDEASGQVALVERLECPQCGKPHLGSADGSLQNLRECIFKTEPPLPVSDAL